MVGQRELWEEDKKPVERGEEEGRIEGDRREGKR